MKIQRDKYLNRLLVRQNNGLIKIVTGIRRCGKSFLLFNLFQERLLSQGVPQDHIVSIALDGIDQTELRDPRKCLQYIKSRIQDAQTYYVLLDEIQFMPRFEEVLNALLRIPNVDAYVTGSNSKFLSSDIVTEFRGRGDEIRLYPLSFAEFYSAYSGDYDDAWEEYLTFGGLPNLVALPTEEQKIEYLKSIFNNVYLKDVVDRHRLQRSGELNSLVDVLASSIGSLTNPTKISRTFASEQRVAYSNATISKHIDLLVDSFLISEAKRFDIKGRKRIGANSKYYFVDVGLRNARLNFRQQEPTHLMENAVYNEIQSRGYTADVGVVKVDQKNAEGKYVSKQLEVDFVVNKGLKQYYIQVAYDLATQEKRDQEFNSLRRIPDSFKKIVIVNGSSKPRYTEEGFIVMGMKYFLLNDDSLEF